MSLQIAVWCRPGWIVTVNSSALQAVEWCNPSTSCYGFCRSIAIIASGDGRQRSRSRCGGGGGVHIGSTHVVGEFWLFQSTHPYPRTHARTHRRTVHYFAFSRQELLKNRYLQVCSQIYNNNIQETCLVSNSQSSAFETNCKHLIEDGFFQVAGCLPRSQWNFVPAHGRRCCKQHHCRLEVLKMVYVQALLSFFRTRCRSPMGFHIRV